MEKLMFVSIIVFIVIVVGVIGSLIVFKNAFLGPASGNLEECTVLKQNSDNGVNVVFFGDDKKEVERYIDYFFGWDPLSVHKDRFNFYYIDYSPECELYNGIAMLCYSRELVRVAGSCPNDQIVVLNDDYSRSIRSSSYLNVASLNVKHPLSVFLHEFGHSFVNLAEEYVPAKIPRNSAGNCAKECSEFKGREDGCYIGCSRADYSRSVENGIMRTLSSEHYGSFNEWVIENKIDELSELSGRVTAKVVDSGVDCAEQEYYLVEGSVEGGLSIVDREIAQGCVGDSGSGGYSFDVILDDDKKVEIGRFNPELIFTDGPRAEVDLEDVLASPLIDGETFDNDRSFFLKVPVIPDAKELQIKEPGLRVVVSIPICDSEIGDVNGDGRIDIFDVEDLDDGLETGYFNCKDNADFNGDSVINLQDRDELYNSLSEEQRNAGGSVASVPLTGNTIFDKIGRWLRGVNVT